MLCFVLCKQQRRRRKCRGLGANQKRSHFSPSLNLSHAFKLKTSPLNLRYLCSRRRLYTEGRSETAAKLPGNVSAAAAACFTCSLFSFMLHLPPKLFGVVYTIQFGAKSNVKQDCVIYIEKLPSRKKNKKNCPEFNFLFLPFKL
jgi:hypothetical protein